MKKYILILLGVFAFSFNTKAQDGFENILLADAQDSQKLMQAYFAPGMEAFINSMNNGWYHTAKVHKPFGFDISIGASGSMIPSEKELFNISALGLVSVSSSSTTAATFGGDQNNTTPMVVSTTINGQNVTANFDAPGGANLPGNFVPAPIAQVNLGLPGKFEAMLRIVPKINIGDNDGSVNMLGLGLKKEITSWFGPMDKTPLHVSLLAAYTTMNVDYGIGDVNSNNLEIRNGLSKFNLKAFTAQAIASLNFPIINLYGGIGFNSGSSSYEMSGTFTGIYKDPLGNDVRQTLSVPSNLDFNSSGLNTTIGARLSLGFFKLFASYTLQEYNALSAGISIGIR